MRRLDTQQNCSSVNISEDHVAAWFADRETNQRTILFVASGSQVALCEQSCNRLSRKQLLLRSIDTRLCLAYTSETVWRTLSAIGLLANTVTVICDPLRRVVCVTVRFTLQSASWVAAGRAWNALPREVSAAPSSSSFRRLLKTHLFRRSYFRDVSARHQRSFLTMFRGLAVLALTQR